MRWSRAPRRLHGEPVQRRRDADRRFTPVLASGSCNRRHRHLERREVFRRQRVVAVGGAGVAIPAGSTALQVRVATIDDADRRQRRDLHADRQRDRGATTSVAATGTATLSDEAVPDTGARQLWADRRP